jgi:hypothetical protein
MWLVTSFGTGPTRQHWRFRRCGRPPLRRIVYWVTTLRLAEQPLEIVPPHRKGTPMTHTVAVPPPVRVAMTAWFVAISAGVAEALIRTTLPDAPTAVQLATRFAIYAALAVLVAALPSGRDIVRWALAVILGGSGPSP